MTDTSMPKKTGYRKSIPLIVIALVALVGAFTLSDYLTFATLRDNRAALIAYRDSHFALTVLAYLAIYITMVTFSLPGAVFVTLAGGFLFGLMGGTLLTVIAATTGATLLFLAARHGFGKALSQKMDASKGKIREIKHGIEENQWSMLFLIRLVPIVPFFVANLIPAFMKVPLSRYVISTFFGIIPGTFVFTSVGSGLGEVFQRGETPDLGIIFAPHVLGPILGLAALSLLPVILKSVTGKKDF